MIEECGTGRYGLYARYGTVGTIRYATIPALTSTHVVSGLLKIASDTTCADTTCDMLKHSIMSKYFPRLRYDCYPLHALGLGLCPFSALLCDVLPRRLLHPSIVTSLAKGALPKSISVTLLMSTAWRTLGLVGAFPTRARIGGGARPGLAPFAGRYVSLVVSEIDCGEWVSPRIHASPPTLWTVVPTCRGLEGSTLN